jgi:GAF domain-containing protein
VLDLTEALLRLVAATSWDGGAGLVHALSEVIREATPFEAGEVAVAQPVEFRRWSLTDDEQDVVESDLLLHVGSCGRPVRVDDLPEVADFPRTHALLRARGLQSLLLFPLASPGGPEGAIVLARTYGWAFAGAPLNHLWPIARMSGLCLERALALTALRRKLDFMGDGERDSRHAEERARRQIEVVRQDLEHAQSELAAVRTELMTVQGQLSAAEAERDALRADPEPASAPGRPRPPRSRTEEN